MTDPEFDPQIPAPATVLEFVAGARPVRYHEMLEYFVRLNAASDRAVLGFYGETAGGRKLARLTISSAENLAWLDAIHADSLLLGDLIPDEPQARVIAARMPLVVWMGYGIHGDELSCSDAAVELAYRLIAGRDATTRGWLDRLVIHIDPMVNPDGRERSVAHVTGFHRHTAVEDVQDIVHKAFWPGGRGNHYLFDLNRDAIFTVQREARQRVAAIVAARPQVLIDAHEMAVTDTYLFAVPAQPLNPHLPADIHDSWQDLAADHAAAFDRDGTSYYTRSWNEVFYPGFFDIWPAYHGAVPMLYEQAANSGVTVRLPNGRKRTYAQAIDNQLRSSLANLATAAAKKELLLLRWWRARKTAAQGEGLRQQTWVIFPDDAYKTAQIVRLLKVQGVAVERLTHAIEVPDLHSCWGDQRHCVTLPVDTLRVRTAQPLGWLVRNLFDFHVPQTGDFLQRERRGLDLGAKTLLYDATAWSLPLAFAADIHWSEGELAGEWRAVAAGDAVAVAPPAYKQSHYGYLYSDPALFVTMRLLARGVKVRVSHESFVHEGVLYEPGSFLIRNDDQECSVVEMLQEESAANATGFIAAESARILSGPDLGGDDFSLLGKPSIAILAGSLADAPCTGALWHLFDVSIGVPVSLLHIEQLAQIDLSAYRTLILPSTTDHDTLVALLKQERLERLRTWVEAGGTLIALSSGARALIDAGLTATKLRRSALREYPPLVFGRSVDAVFQEDFIDACGACDQATLNTRDEDWTRPVIGAGALSFLTDPSIAFEFPDRVSTLSQWLGTRAASHSATDAAGATLRKYLPGGAYLRADLKPSHWLRYGVASRIPVLFRESDALIAEAGAEAIGRFGAPRQLALSGLVWPEAVGYIAGTAYLVREKKGRGQILLFAADPVFRGYSLGTQRLLLNAVVLGTALATAS